MFNRISILIKNALSIIILLLTSNPVFAQNTFPSTGNVGIGTTSPAKKLEIKDGLNMIISLGNNQEPALILSRWTGNSNIYQTSLVESESNGSMYGLSLRTSNGNHTYNNYSGAVTRLHITQEGKIGIGTLTPGRKLEIRDGFGSKMITALGVNQEPALILSRWTGSGNYYQTGLVESEHNGTDYGLSLRTTNGGHIENELSAAVTRLHITQAGNVGIGTVKPIARLDITGGWNSLAKTTLPPGGIRFYTPTGTSNTTYPWNINVNSAGILEFASGSPAVSGAESVSTKVVFGSNGNVGIGTTSPGVYKLAVEGKIGAREVNVTLASWSDFVFFDSYKLRPLSEVETFIQKNKHLPDVPSAAVVEKEGVNLGEMDAILLRKIEELTLYTIQTNKKMDDLKEVNREMKLEDQRLKKENEYLKNELQKLKTKR